MPSYRSSLTAPRHLNRGAPRCRMKWTFAPGERKELALLLAGVSTNGLECATIRVTGEFGSAGKPVLLFRLVPP